MAGQKPNNFQPLASLVGNEELYSQANDTPRKFTVETLKDYIEANLTGTTDTDWIQASNTVYNLTDDIGVGVIPTAKFEVLGDEKHVYNGAYGDLTREVTSTAFTDIIREELNNNTDEVGFTEKYLDLLGDVHFFKRITRAGGFGNLDFNEDQTIGLKSEIYTNTSGFTTGRYRRGSAFYEALVQQANAFGITRISEIEMFPNSIRLSHRALNLTSIEIEMTQNGAGNAGIKITGLQTGSAGLAAGELYKDASGFIKIV